ncbi:MAG: DPP IV N-terminal domain-containing protein [Phycisphaerae bacterium]|nr:DPP IV N-terminal domain-containing protein [Phycisphaerae bacterium]
MTTARFYAARSFFGCPTRTLAAMVVAACAANVASPAHAQWTPYHSLPNAERVRAASTKLRDLERGSRVRDVRWDLEGKRVLVRIGEEWKAIALDGSAEEKLDAEPSIPPTNEARRERRPPAPSRGRQQPVASSPDGAHEARYRDGNLFLKINGADEKAITTDGDGKLKYGSASWVYGEELDQTTAMWWSPDSKKLAFYKFDDRQVKDFVLLKGWTKLHNAVMTEAYPKPGQANPIAGLMLLDVASGAMTTIDVGPDTNQYIYEIEWVPDSSGILFRRTNRRQDTLELVFADGSTGATRVLLTEKQASWQENSPDFRFLKDGRRYLWETEANGFSNYQLRSLDTDAVIDVTKDAFAAMSILRVDEERGTLWYVARSSAIAINPQLHRAKLDGSGAVRLTPDDMHWSGFRIAPDGSGFIATKEFIDVPPSTELFRVEGDRAVKVATLAAADSDPWAKASMAKPEFLKIKAADGTTDLYGVLWKPSDFDSTKKYPLVVSTYGGPFFAMINSTVQGPRGECEFGVLLATIDNRGTPGRGKAFEAANYLSLGEEDCDDQAALVRQLCERPYVDASRVAITGHSYGGFMTVNALLRYPNLFQVGVAGAPPTDWRNYDTIYTERYMRTPEENPEGYDNYSCVKQATKLKGKLLLLHGLVDDNVHPNNTFQLAQELQSNDIPFQMMIFPTSGHGIASPAEESLKWSFILEAFGMLPGGEKAVNGSHDGP